MTERNADPDPTPEHPPQDAEGVNTDDGSAGTLDQPRTNDEGGDAVGDPVDDA